MASVSGATCAICIEFDPSFGERPVTPRVPSTEATTRNQPNVSNVEWNFIFCDAGNFSFTGASMWTCGHLIRDALRRLVNQPPHLLATGLPDADYRPLRALRRSNQPSWKLKRS